MDVSVGFDGSVGLVDTIAIARHAEAVGLHAVWNAEHMGLHDAVVASTAHVMVTSRLNVGLVGQSVIGRHPVVLAMEISSLAELAGPRLRVQLGLGDERFMQQLGGTTGEWKVSPLQVVEGFVSIMRKLTAGEVVTDNLLGYVMNDCSLGSPRQLPIDVMAMRPKMIQLAARVGDGVSLSIGASRSYLTGAVSRIRAVTDGSGQTRRVTAFVYGAIGETVEQAAAHVGRRLALLDPDLLHVLASGDPDLPLVEALREVIDNDGQRAVAAHLPLGLIERCGLVATPASLNDVLATFDEIGIDELVVLLTAKPADQMEQVSMLGRAAAACVAGVR